MGNGILAHIPSPYKYMRSPLLSPSPLRIIYNNKNIQETQIWQIPQKTYHSTAINQLELVYSNPTGYTTKYTDQYLSQLHWHSIGPVPLIMPHKSGNPAPDRTNLSTSHVSSRRQTHKTLKMHTRKKHKNEEKNTPNSFIPLHFKRHTSYSRRRTKQPNKHHKLE